MTLAERCDEIVRLIDATLAEITVSDHPVSDRPVSDRPVSDRPLSDRPVSGPTVSKDCVPGARAVTASDSRRLRAAQPIDPAA